MRCGCSSVPFICRLGAETARTRRGLRGVLAWSGDIPYLDFSSSKSTLCTAEKEQCNNADGSYLSSSFNNAIRTLLQCCNLHFGIDHIHFAPTFLVTISGIFFFASFTVLREICFLSAVLNISSQGISLPSARAERISSSAWAVLVSAVMPKPDSISSEEMSSYPSIQ